MYRNILLAVDGSPTSDVALHEAVKLVKEGAHLRVITVVDNPTLTFPAPYGVSYDAGAVRDAMLEGGRGALKHAMDQLEALEVPAESRLIDLTDTLSNNVAGAILNEAREWPADLIVVGSHGRRGIKRFVLGSVAEQVMRAATLPVLLVRPASAAGKNDPAGICREWPDEMMGG